MYLCSTSWPNALSRRFRASNLPSTPHIRLIEESWKQSRNARLHVAFANFAILRPYNRRNMDNGTNYTKGSFLQSSIKAALPSKTVARHHEGTASRASPLAIDNNFLWKCSITKALTVDCNYHTHISFSI